MTVRRALAAIGCAAALASCAAASAPIAATPLPAGQPGAIPPGLGQQLANLGETPVTVFTYRPDGCTPSTILLVFHGLERNAARYRDDAVPLAQRYCMLVAAPLFDAARFPDWRYQHGGIVHRGAVQPAESWTVAMVPRLVAWVRAGEANPRMAYAAIGHSAGAQFLSRAVAFGGEGAARAVIANPSTWVRPRLDVPAPYGFGGVFPPAQGEAALKRYLAAPITVLLGREDTGSRNLATSEEAEDQGTTRFERGQTVFGEAQAAAREHGWAFNWQLAVVPGTGHNARRMFTSDQAFAALRP